MANVEDIVGRTRKPAEGVMDIDKFIDGGWMSNRGETFTKPTSELYTDEFRRGECDVPSGNWHKP